MSDETGTKIDGKRQKGKPSKETVLKLWSKTYDTDGKPDWSHIFGFYHENIIFQDTIQRIEGIDEFKKLCNRLTKRCSHIDMEIFNITENENTVMMDWKMTMSFRKSPSTPIYGSTRLTFDQEGIITHQRDYYDLWGDIFNGIPGFRRMYRWFMAKLFG